jgi:hypothetical protein
VTMTRLRPAAVVIAPAVLFAGFAYHPYVSNATDAEAIASAVIADTTRRGLAHLAIGVGYALMVLALLAIRSYLREGGEERWISVALPLAAVGNALFAILPGMDAGRCRDGRRRRGGSGGVDAVVHPDPPDGSDHAHDRRPLLRNGDLAQRSAHEAGAAAGRRRTRRHGSRTFSYL